MQNQIYEGVEKDLDYDDHGEEYDWSSTCLMPPEGEDPKMWLQERSKENVEQVLHSLQLY